MDKKLEKKIVRIKKDLKTTRESVDDAKAYVRVAESRLVTLLNHIKDFREEIARVEKELSKNED